MEVAPRSAWADLLMRGWCHNREVLCGEYTNPSSKACACVCVCLCRREWIHAVGVFLCLLGDVGKGMMCVFVSGSLRCQHTDTLCLCGVQEVKRSQSRGGVSSEDWMLKFICSDSMQADHMTTTYALHCLFCKIQVMFFYFSHFILFSADL